MALPAPVSLAGLLSAPSAAPAPSADELKTLLSLVERSYDETFRCSEKEIALLSKYGLNGAAYRALTNEAQSGNRQPLASLLQREGLTRLANECAGALATPVPVTAYIPCYNGAAFIAGAIRSLKAQSYPIHEILVVDDASTDGSGEIAAAHGAKVIRHSSNRGLGSARNTALGAAQGEYVASIDADVEAHPLWLEREMEFLSGKPEFFAGGRLIERNSLSVPDGWRARVMKQHHGITHTEGMVVFGCNAVGRKGEFQAVGGYSTQYTKSFEDVDFTNRVLAGGRRTAYLPNAYCWHGRSDSLQSVLDTAYNWRAPPFDAANATRDLSVLLSKWSVTVRGDQEELAFLDKEGRTELLCVTFLGTIYSIGSDLIRFEGIAEGERAEFRAGGLALLALAAARIPGAGTATKTALLKTLAMIFAKIGHSAPKELDSAFAVGGSIPAAELLNAVAPNLSKTAASQLLFGLGELHLILNLPPALFLKVEAGASSLIGSEISKRTIINFPGSRSTGGLCIGAALDPFDWIEMVAGTDGKGATLDATTGDPLTVAYLLLRLAERAPELPIALRYGGSSEAIDWVLRSRFPSASVSP